MPSRVLASLPAFVALAVVVSPIQAQTDDANFTVDPGLYAALRYRLVGPTRGGRSTAVTGYVDRPHTFLMGTTGGGIWRTDDAGTSWINISDGFLHVGPVGALAVAPSNPNVVYAGTGSGGVRGNVSVGDGVYRTTDDGRTWRWIGLPESRHINRIWVHPRNPDHVWVAALGSVFGPSANRGVYRTTNGGRTWQKVLYVNDGTGAIDLILSPDDPATLYAAMWTARRTPWAMFSGSQDGGVFKSTDGGDTWTKLSGGLPAMLGRIGLAMSAANPDRLYVLAEAEGDLRGLYRSEDRGASFTHVSDDRNMLARPWYYTHVDADPTDADVVYVNNEAFFRSDDGGRTLINVTTPHGDNHDIWINPNHPEILIQSNDGGANVTLNGGRTWSTQYNQPTAEFYTVTADDRFPYRLYAPQQDNTTISVPSRITRGLTPSEDWFRGPGCETGPITVDPRNPDILYGACKGWVSRLDRRSNQLRQVWIWPQEGHGLPNAEYRYREQWVSQLRFSPHDPTVLYHTSQYVHVSRNEGQDWEVISPDLTRWREHADLHVDPPGGPLTYDQTGVEVYATIFAFEESPHRQGLFWAGSDDGAIHISRDGGDTWDDITPPGLPLHSTVNEIVLSPHDAGRAFAVVQRYRMDDFHPYLYRTDDYGSSWTLLTDGTNGIPEDHPTRTIQEDPVVKGLLYAGTEFGMFISFDDGAHWQPFQQNLPRTPIMDLLVKDDDLVVATQGRALWILDDITPLRQVEDARAAGRGPYLFAPRAAYRTRLQNGFRGTAGAENPPDGAALYYSFGDDMPGEWTLEVRDSEGELVRLFTSSGPGTKEEVFQAMREPTVTVVGSPRVQTTAGMHRLVWDLEYPPAYLAPGVNEGIRERIAVVTGRTEGPLALPGTYIVTLSSDTWSQTRTLEVRLDPRVTTPMSELEEQFRLGLRVRDRITEIQLGVAAGNRRIAEMEAVIARGGRDASRATAAKAEIEEVLRQLYKHRLRGDHANLRPQLTTDYAAINTYISGSENRPPSAAYPRMRELDDRFERLMGRLRTLLERPIA